MGSSKNLMKDSGSGEEGIQAGATTSLAAINTSFSVPPAIGLLSLLPVGSTQIQAPENAATGRDKQKDLALAVTTGWVWG